MTKSSSPLNFTETFTDKPFAVVMYSSPVENVAACDCNAGLKVETVIAAAQIKANAFLNVFLISFLLS